MARKPRKPRNYQAEYQRRKLRRAGIDAAGVIRDKHRKGYKATPVSRKRGLKKAGIDKLLDLSEIEFDDEMDFIEALKSVGFKENEAYALWTSP